MYTNLDSMILGTKYEELKKEREEESAENENCIATWQKKPAFLEERMHSENRTQVSWPVKFLEDISVSHGKDSYGIILPWVSNCKPDLGGST